jgi:hypothetical protein
MSADLLLVPSLAFVQNVGRLIVGTLAVAGGAFLGGLLIGLLTQVLAKMLTTRSVPRAALTFVRLLGAVVGGVLVWMMLFGSSSGGGDGWGLGGWSGLGPGKGTGGEQPVKPNGTEHPKPPDKPPSSNGKPPHQASEIRIEVLGDQPQPERRFYRVEGEPKLQTLPEVTETLSRKKDLKKVVIVLYKNSPDRDTTVVRDLEQLIQARGLTPEISLDPRRSP